MKGLNYFLILFVLAFLIVGALFGMNIMTYMYAHVEKANIGTIPDLTEVITNETNGYINETGYILTGATASNYAGPIIVTSAYNATNGELITPANYTVNNDTGAVTNLTNTNFNDVNFSYTYLYKSDIKLNSEQIGNESIKGAATYAANSDTQLNITSIAIILVILIILFLIWQSFLAPMLKGQKSNKQGNFA